MVLLVLTTALLTSCYRERDSIAEIMVIDDNSSVVSNAMVRLYPTPTGGGGPIVIDDTLYTDANGIATFDFSHEFEPGQTGLLVLDIEVKTTNGKYGTGLIRIEEQETNQATIIVQ